MPAIILAAGLALGLRGDELKQVFLIGVLPAATAVPTLALAHGIYAEDASASVFASTLFAIVSISVGMVVAAHL